MSKSGRRTGICALCGTFTALTGEDATPKWLGRLLSECFPANQWEAVEYTPGVVGPRKRARNVDSPAAYKVKILCGPCNGVWGSQLETEAKPLLSALILGEPVKLGQTEQALVATWATKTVLLYEFVKPAKEGTTASRDDRVWFRRNRKPLPDSHLWIGRYEGTGGAHIITRSTQMLFNSDQLVPQPIPHVLLSVVVMGQLAIRVLIHRSRVVYPIRCEFGEGEAIHPIWPTGEPINWPVTEGLDDASFNEFMALRSQPARPPLRLSS